jgi:hypothetical protein
MLSKRKAGCIFIFLINPLKSLELLNPPCVVCIPREVRKTAFVNKTALAVHPQPYLCACFLLLCLLLLFLSAVDCLHTFFFNGLLYHCCAQH